MEAYHNTRPADWLGKTVTDIGKRLRDDARSVAKAIKTGLHAAHDYQAFSARTSREAACRMVFAKHFSQ